MAEKLPAIVLADSGDSTIFFLPFYILLGIIKPLTFLQRTIFTSWQIFLLLRERNNLLLWVADQTEHVGYHHLANRTSVL